MLDLYRCDGGSSPIWHGEGICVSAVFLNPWLYVQQASVVRVISGVAYRVGSYSSSGSAQGPVGSGSFYLNASRRSVKFNGLS